MQGRPAIPSAVAAPPAYPGGPAQRPTPTTTPVASGVGASSKGATTDSEEEDQPPAGAVAKGEGEANAAAGHRSPPPGGAAGGNGGSAAPPAALENLPSVVATGKTVHPQHSWLLQWMQGLTHQRPHGHRQAHQRQGIMIGERKRLSASACFLASTVAPN